MEQIYRALAKARAQSPPDPEVSPRLLMLDQKIRARSKGDLEHARGGTISGKRPNPPETAPCMRLPSYSANGPHCSGTSSKDNSCERSEPRVVLMVGRARRVGTEPVIGIIFLPTSPREAIPGMVVGEKAAQLPEQGSIRAVLAEIASKTPDFGPSGPLGREWPDAGGEGGRITSPSPGPPPRALPLLSDGTGRGRSTRSPFPRTVCSTAAVAASAGAG